VDRPRSAPKQLVWCCAKCGAIYHKDFARCPSDGAEIITSDKDPLPGTQIAQYVIGSLLGEGGMGRVYRAHHADLAHKSYAIKVLLGDWSATASMRKRFAKEAKIASKLSHRNVVSVLDFGETKNGLPYIVMELVEGNGLGAMIDRAPMDPQRVVHLARGMCAGLAYAHAAGLVHRDLKPDNVIVASKDGSEVPRITDFGLAVDGEPSRERLTTTGTVMGTPAYAAPEQLQGKALDARADLYALGMTMFEMLTGGVLPFDGSPVEISAAKTHREAPPISERVPSVRVPPALQAIITKLLRRRREERFAETSEVDAALDAVRFEATFPSPTIKVPRASPWMWIALGTLAVFLVTFVGGWWFAHRQDAPVATAEAAALPVAASPPAPPAAAPVVAEVEPAPVVELPVKQQAHPHAPPRRAKIEVAPAPLPVAPLPAPKPHASIAAVDVHGALAVAEVQRAVDRVAAGLDRCAPDQPQDVVVELSIGEARRAEHVHASGAAATASCVAGVLSAIRTESAPDVGDASVTVKVAFVVK
jgi:serine/threonine-protein kinase